MLKVCYCAKQVDGLTASRQILTSKKDSIKPPMSCAYVSFILLNSESTYHAFYIYSRQV
jgi:hypothetical protein